MSRLLKKCLFLSIGLHILLAAALLICTAFFVVKPEKIMPTLSMIAPDVLDNLLNPRPVSTPRKNPNPPPPSMSVTNSNRVPSHANRTGQELAFREVSLIGKVCPAAISISD